jgi:hypothetical protein
MSASFLALAALVAACGGGGGGAGTPPTGGGGSTPTIAPTGTPAPASTPSDSGSISVSGLSFADANIVYTCGCSGEGGEITTDANGNYTITGTAKAIPTQSTAYSPPGHNLMVVAYADNSHTQAWTMLFMGNSAATNLNLSSTPNNATANVTDTASTGAALYVYYQDAYSPQITGSDRTFDWFNYNQIIAFAQHLRTAPSTNETKFLSDISSAQQSGTSLFPGFLPTWNADAADSTNATIATDIQNVAQDGTAVDATLPTPCPAANACSGAPTP